MIKVNNKHGIEFYYDIDEDCGRIFIYDSYKNFFNDLLYRGEEDELDSYISDLENTTLEDMCDFMWFNVYNNMEDIIKEYDDKYINTINDVLNTGYLNIFKVNGKEKYCLYQGV